MAQKATHVPWESRKQIPDAQVLDAADQFETAAQVLWKARCADGMLLPFLNTSVMAVELYLKSLSSESVHVQQIDGGALVYAQPDVEKHPPSVLLNAVPKDIRLKMEKAYAKRPDAEGLTLPARCKMYDSLLMASRYPFVEDLTVNGISIDWRNCGTPYPLADRLLWRDVTSRIW